ncbi:MAG: hypothetical protein PHU06_04125 [Gallionella sp.]|nr:hypothetical protein [Gallionella sp.]MDD4958699.1 hypothetical protein [Gallionella sp.]
MAQFIAFDKNAEVAGHSILSTLSTFPEYYRAEIEQFFKDNNVTNVTPDSWHSQQSYLNVCKDISTRYGPSTLFNAGVAVGESVPFPPGTTLQAAFAGWNDAYLSHHRNGYLMGYIKLLSFDPQAKKAVVECKNPYPSHFERGIATTFARKCKPKDAAFIDVQLDNTMKSRLDGADSCFYVITWI